MNACPWCLGNRRCLGCGRGLGLREIAAGNNARRDKVLDASFVSALRDLSEQTDGTRVGDFPRTVRLGDTLH